jgi:hypothetical protein
MAKRVTRKRRKTAIVPKVVLSLALGGVIPALGMSCSSPGPQLTVAAIFDMQFSVAAIFDMASDMPQFTVAAIFDMTNPDGGGGRDS